MLLWVPDGPNIITIAAGMFAASTAFSNILYFVFYRNRSSKYITQWGTGYL